MKIYLGTDHAGFVLKEEIKIFLEEKNVHDIVDQGAFVLNENDDYPDFIMPVAHSVADDHKHGIESVGIVFGGSGYGEMMAANRIVGARCALYCAGVSHEIVALSRTHNDANMLSIGARFTSVDDAKDVITLWLDTKFSGDERHVRRLQKMDLS